GPDSFLKDKIIAFPLTVTLAAPEDRAAVPATSVLLPAQRPLFDAPDRTLEHRRGHRARLALWRRPLVGSSRTGLVPLRRSSRRHQPVRITVSVNPLSCGVRLCHLDAADSARMLDDVAPSKDDLYHAHRLGLGHSYVPIVVETRTEVTAGLRRSERIEVVIENGNTGRFCSS